MLDTSGRARSTGDRPAPGAAVLRPATAGRPTAARLRPPSWRDARLVVGVLLVLASVAVGARVVAAADETVPVWAAAGDLPPGRALADGDLQVVRVRLGAGTAAYLSAVSAPPAGSVLLRPLTSGELVPVSAVGPASTWTRRPVSVPVAGQVPEGVRVGARVDLWSSARDTAAGPAGSSTYRPPVRLAAAAEVFSVAAPGRGLGAVQGSAVQVLLGEQELPAALDALANGARLTLVPAP